MGGCCALVWVVETRRRHGGEASERRGQVLRVRVQGTEEEEDGIRGREGERGDHPSPSAGQDREAMELICNAVPV